MVTVLAGYLTAAVIAVKNIDLLLHIVHDNSVEEAIRLGLDGMKDAYKAKQELLLERLKSKIKDPANISASSLEGVMKSITAEQTMGSSSFNVKAGEKNGSVIQWIDRNSMAVGPHMVQFFGSQKAEEYRISEDVLRRYQIIGLELRERIRPALIKALSITLAVMCLLLLFAFVYMALRSKTRIQKLVQGFRRYADGEDTFRFDIHWKNELALLSLQFNRMADELDYNRAQALSLEKLASWQTIARKMAHEIKNPLTPIQIMTSQLKRKYDGSDEEFGRLLEKAHDVILEEVSGLRRMVDDFSQFAQLPSPRFELCDVVQCAQKAIALVKDSYAPHTISFEGPSVRIEAEIDEQLIRQALHNLIKNAAEADPLSSSPITIRLIENPGQIVFEIEDQGPGIPSDLKDKIFEAYVTTKHTGPVPGMGLGLAICQKIILEHGGRISVDTSKGRTVFKISTPRFRKGVRS
jgi:nitrogen fixation/metabolism regulation signal transduction histidine kinase